MTNIYPVQVLLEKINRLPEYRFEHYQVKFTIVVLKTVSVVNCFRCRLKAAKRCLSLAFAKMTFASHSANKELKVNMSYYINNDIRCHILFCICFFSNTCPQDTHMFQKSIAAAGEAVPADIACYTDTIPDFPTLQALALSTLTTLPRSHYNSILTPLAHDYPCHPITKMLITKKRNELKFEVSECPHFLILN